MKNAIRYYYNINPDEIHQINQTFKFHISNYYYILYPCNNTIEEINKLNDIYIYLNNNGIYCHKIIPNINKQIITIINNTQYVLLNIQIENRKINIFDILYYINIKIDYKNLTKIKRYKWKNMWEEKIDYIEYQISQFGKKYPLVRESSDYFIGVAENCIQLLNNVNWPQNVVISHRRVTPNTTTEEFYNPFNFILDIKVRDLGEYIKTYIYENNIMDIIQYVTDNLSLDKDELLLLFIRIMYPSEYIDEYEQIIENDTNENKMAKIIEKIDIYEKNIKKIYQHISRYTYIPEIDWLKKINQY